MANISEEFMMKAVSFVSVIAIFTLGACSHYSDDLASMDSQIYKAAPATQVAMAPQDIAPAAGGAAFSTETLNAALAREYYSMARFENDKAFDYKAAKQYTAKAKMASAGKLVVPSKISAFDIPADRVGELTQARAELINALKTQNTPENQPSLAKAQTSYDCWLERAEEADADAHFAECKGTFEQAMANLIATAAGTTEPAPSIYDITFGANAALMNEASRKDIAHIANHMKAPENTAQTVQILGVIGTTQGEFGHQLATARMKAVQDALIERGVDAARISPIMSPSVNQEAGKVQVMLMNNAAHPNIETKTEYVPLAQPVPAPVEPVQAPSVYEQAPASAPAPKKFAPAKPSQFN